MAKKAGKEPEVPEEAPDEVEVSEPEAEVAEIVEVLAEPSVEEVLAGERDRYLRLLAEYENYRKRTAKERETLYSDAKAEMLAKLLPVYDNLARADQNKGGDEKTNQAIAMMKQQFEHIAESSGVELLRDETEREKPFDPTRHNAINPVAPGGEISVAMVVQCGCAVGGKVIRPADVAVVATAISET